MMQTLSQRRAAKALELLNAIPEKGDKRAEFRQFCKGFPTMVLKNGLGQALAFIKTKQDRKYENIYNTLNAWLRDELKLVNADVFREINTKSSKEYMEIQAESLRFLEWVKRYENAEIF